MAGEIPMDPSVAKQEETPGSSESEGAEQKLQEQLNELRRWRDEVLPRKMGIIIDAAIAIAKESGIEPDPRLTELKKEFGPKE